MKGWKNMKRNLKEALKNQRGITLVALVITIVILIILATVAINFAFGNNGLINRAEDAKKYYANDTVYTEESLSNVESYIDGLIGENGGSGPEEPGTPTTVEEAKKNETKFDKTTTIKDGQDNSVVIPGDFHVDKDSGTNVEEGIVIEDDLGNQFVWIPVGTYKTTKGEKTNNLARRSWGAKNVVVQEPQEVTEVDTAIDYYYYAEDTTKYTSVAKDTIEAFKTSSTTKGGFYIGRYEAGTEEERTSASEPVTTPLVQANKNAYVYVTRDQAKAQSEAMYSESQFVKSELISSYAWDTALNFICQNSEHGYKLATTTDKTYGNIYTSKKRINRSIYNR